MKFSDRLISALRAILPSPFSLAILLTVLTFVLALLFTQANPSDASTHGMQLLKHWYGGLWKLSEFAMQMSLMLVLGHVLALSAPFGKLLDLSVLPCKTGPKAALWVTLLATSFAMLNWGLGLIIGALFARKVAEHAAKNLIPINYPLVAAAGYSGLMVWHGGISGSAPLKVNDPKHMFIELTNGQPISIEHTLLSHMNLAIGAACLVILPLAMFLLARKAKSEVPKIGTYSDPKSNQIASSFAEKLDFAPIFSKLTGLALLFAFLYIFWIGPGKVNLSAVDPNLVNLFFLGLALLLHRNVASFLSATETAIVGTVGIFLQFPLYAGITGLLAGSGLLNTFSQAMVEFSGPTSFFLLVLLSAGIVNFFIPSGGGQWAVQGGIVLAAANKLGLSQPKAVMALAYGDQLTNMMQPFWAVPLLSITGLKAADIMPYTLFLMLLGSLIFSTGLILF